MRTRLAAAAGIVALLAACANEPRRPEPLEIEEVDVGAPVDAGLSTAGDEKGAAPRGSDSWILSGMLPDDLPLHRPARLVDSGDAEGGKRYFVFHTASPLEAVKGGLAGRLGGAGWTATPVAAGLTASKGGERVDFSFTKLEPGTEIRVVY